jgi:hypothetical protein
VRLKVTLAEVVGQALIGVALGEEVMAKLRPRGRERTVPPPKRKFSAISQLPQSLPDDEPPAQEPANQKRPAPRPPAEPVPSSPARP